MAQPTQTPANSQVLCMSYASIELLYLNASYHEAFSRMHSGTNYFTFVSFLFLFLKANVLIKH